MKIYARIDADRVVEIIEPTTYDIDWSDADGSVIHRAGDEIAIGERFTAEFVQTLLDVTSIVPKPEQGWAYDGVSFEPFVPPPPSPAEIMAHNTAIRDTALSVATSAIAPLQDAVDLDEATESEIALLKLWKQYRVAVSRVNLTLASPTWPSAPSA